MRPIHWLHISDVHLRSGNQWSQDIVSQALCESIGKQREGGITADLILVTGDIAFSGKCEEYALAESFFKELIIASKVPLERIFCIPGNHDIDRDRHSICFTGALSELKNTNKVDAILGDCEDLKILLTRQAGFRHFQKRFFEGQVRNTTEDGLGYVSKFAIEEIQLAIIGLDSAWLAEGGEKDHGRLLIGERQVINAIRMGYQGESKPHVVLAMAHHPFHLLQEFDRPLVQRRVEESAHFFHCGHLHEPESRLAGPVGTGCLTVTAGASYETRQSRHAYSMVTLDLLEGVRRVSVFRYNPRNGTYLIECSDDFPIELAPIAMCSLDELAVAIQVTYPSLEPISHYLAALTLGKKTEIPILTDHGFTFGSFEALKGLGDEGLNREANHFLNFSNIIRVLYGREELMELLSRYGQAVEHFGNALVAECEAVAGLGKRLAELEADSKLLVGFKPKRAHGYSLDLLRELAENQEWDQLREQAERHLKAPNLAVSSEIKRILALALANSDDFHDRSKATELYRELAQSQYVEFSDIGNMAILLLENGSSSEARDAVLDGLERFPEKKPYFIEIGHNIVQETGDRQLRDRIEN